MSSTIVIGAQWGDEGKGKIVDIFAEKADLVVRFQGGNNAGHTLVIGDQKTVLHHIPSGILRPEVQCILAGGVVVDPEVCLREIKALTEKGVLSREGQLVIGAECSVITSYHRTLDAAREGSLEGTKIGTTGRGIGPCYEDRVARRSIFVRDLLDRKGLEAKLTQNLHEKNVLLAHYGAKTFSVEELLDELLSFGEALRPYVADANALVRNALQDGKKVLFEGAQGTLLDVGLGTYPYVTSSHTVSASACVGAGIKPQALTSIFGITKAYCTRVGEGPFPTELHGDDGEELRKLGHEFGSTTGRPRRCGWLDLVGLKYAADVNGLTSIAITKLDVLSGFDQLKVCTGYLDKNSRPISEPPLDARELEGVSPVYEELAGWSEDLTQCRTWADLPKSARDYIEFIEAKVGVPVALISVGPDREATFWRHA